MVWKSEMWINDQVLCLIPPRHPILFNLITLFPFSSLTKPLQCLRLGLGDMAKTVITIYFFFYTDQCR